MFDVARRKGFVKWTRSLRIERLTLTDDGQNIVAVNVVSKATHWLRPFEQYHCKELSPDELVKLGDFS